MVILNIDFAENNTTFSLMIQRKKQINSEMIITFSLLAVDIRFRCVLRTIVLGLGITMTYVVCDVGQHNLIYKAVSSNSIILSL